jgi:hypothetical protein
LALLLTAPGREFAVSAVVAGELPNLVDGTVSWWASSHQRMITACSPARQEAPMKGSAVFAALLVATTGGLLAGSVYRDDGVWRGSAESGVMLDQAGLNESALGDGGIAERPIVAECDWDPPPRSDSELDIPNPDDFLAGGFLSSETVEFNGHRLPVAELVDLLRIAEDSGISLEEAIFRYGWQNQFAIAATELEETYPEQFAGAGVIDDGCRAWIAFSGSVPDSASELAEAVPVPVDLIGDRGFSAGELGDTLVEAYYSLVQHPEVANASGGTDIEAGVITIHAQPRSSTGPEERDVLCGALRPSHRPILRSQSSSS